MESQYLAFLKPRCIINKWKQIWTWQDHKRGARGRRKAATKSTSTFVQAQQADVTRISFALRLFFVFQLLNLVRHQEVGSLDIITTQTRSIAFDASAQHSRFAEQFPCFSFLALSTHLGNVALAAIQHWLLELDHLGSQPWSSSTRHSEESAEPVSLVGVEDQRRHYYSETAAASDNSRTNSARTTRESDSA